MRKSWTNSEQILVVSSETVNERGNLIDYRDTDVGDLVLIYLEKKPTLYARIESIEPDIKKGWYQVSLLLLTIPPKPMVWILRREYINGVEFTMGGNPIRLEKVKYLKEQAQTEQSETEKEAVDKNPKVIPFKKRRDKD